MIRDLSFPAKPGSSATSAHLATHAGPVLRALAGAGFVLALVTAMITSDIQGLIHYPSVYDTAIEEHGAAEASGIGEEQLLRAAHELRLYLTDRRPLGEITVQVDGQTVPLFSDREETHLEDVKARIVFVQWAQVLSLVYVALFLVVVGVLSRRRALPMLGRLLVTAGLVALAAVAGAGVLLATGFDQFWDSFHELLFSNDFWLLDPSRDHLIQMFPETFWQHLVVFLALLFAAQAVILMAAGALMRPKR